MADPSFLSLANATLEIFRPDSNYDARNAVVEGYASTPSHRGIPCSIGQATPQEKVKFGRDESSVLMKVEVYDYVNIDQTMMLRVTYKNRGTPPRILFPTGPIDDTLGQGMCWLTYAEYKP